MKRTICDSCGRISPEHAPMTGWFVEIPDSPDEPWFAACSPRCVEALGRSIGNLTT